MNALDIIIKNKLWFLLKETEPLETALLNYLFYQSKIEIIDEIKSEDILKNMFHQLLEASYPLKNEKKLFDFLIKQLGEDYIRESIGKENRFIVTYNWSKRQKDKKNKFKDFLKYIPEVNNGLLLYVAILLKDETLTDYAIIKNKNKQFEMTLESDLFPNKNTTINVNFLTESSFKNQRKIYLLNRFDSHDDEIIDLFNSALNGKDIPVINWLLLNKTNELIENKSKIYLPKTIDKELEKILLDNVFLFRENNYSMNKIFSLLIEINSLEETLNKFESCNYNFDYYSKEILNKFINEDNYKDLLTTRTLKKEDVIKRIWRLSIKLEEKIIFSQKYLQENKLNENESLDILFENLNIDTKEKIIGANIFHFSYISLFMYFFDKDEDLSIFLAKNIEKKELLKYKKHVSEEKHKKFELIYFS